MKKLLAWGTLIALLWGLVKLWPNSKRESDARVEVKVNARKPKARHRKTRTARERPSAQPRYVPERELERVEV
jgi:hypothetical protein